MQRLAAQASIVHRRFGALRTCFARRHPTSHSLSYRRALRAGRDPAAQGAPRTGYVQQEDLFYAQMTVQETLDMVAALRLPKALSAEARGAAVDEVLAMLDLSAVRGTVVGDRKTRGISGARAPLCGAVACA